LGFEMQQTCNTKWKAIKEFLHSDDSKIQTKLSRKDSLKRNQNLLIKQSQRTHQTITCAA